MKKWMQKSRIKKIFDYSVQVIDFIVTCVISCFAFAFEPGAYLQTLVLPTLAGFCYMLGAGIYSTVYSSITVLVSFVTVLIVTPTYAYKVAVVVPVFLLADALRKGGFYKSLRKTLLGMFFMILVNMCSGFIMSGILGQQYEVDDLLTLSIHTLQFALPQSIVGVGFLYLHYSVFPAWLRDFFGGHAFFRPMDGYLEEIKKAKQLFAKTENDGCKQISDKWYGRLSRRLSFQITMVTILLSVSAAVSANILFPTVAANSLQTDDGYAVELYYVNEDGEEVREYEVDELIFETSSATVIFDLKIVLMLICVAIPVIILGDFIAQTRIGYPILRMSTALQTLSVKDVKERERKAKEFAQLDIHTRDEIETLYRSTVAMVEESVEFLNWYRDQQELEKELEIAKRSSEEKRNFLSSMSHEMRTPLNAILGFDEMIIRESTNNAITNYAMDIRSSGQTLLNLINDILDFSRIEAGKLDILNANYDLSSVIHDLVHTIQKRARDKHLELRVKVNENLPYLLCGDEIRIKQVISNILTNAVKYTNEGSITLEIWYEKADEKSIYLWVSVEDTGIGMKEEDLEKLSKPFERIEEERNRSIEGTGLGMSIVMNLLHLMDSKLYVESTYGKGSRFYFKVKQEVVDEKRIGDYTARYEESLTQLRKDSESFHAPDARILVVDDTEINLAVIVGLLEPTQVQVETASSGMEALDMVKETKYDAIFLDHRMPGLDGIETLQAMKTLMGNQNKDVPCIALTANAGSGAREEYLEAGFLEYLSKPVRARDLEAVLRRFLPEEKMDSIRGRNDTPLVPKEQMSEEEKELRKQLANVYMVDADLALQNCGSAKVLKNVIENFVETAEEKADAIDEYMEEHDFKNYTIMVHALKSSARLVGAMRLSDEAAYLEECGNNLRVHEIEERTERLTVNYVNLATNLMECTKLGTVKADLPLIPLDQLQDAYQTIKELVQVDDFGSAREVFDMLSDYRVPPEEEEKYKKVKNLLIQVKRETILEVL